MGSKAVKLNKEQQAFFNEAIRQALEIGKRIGRKRREKTPFELTEERLYALPVLQARMNRKIESLSELREVGLHHGSSDIVRFRRGGVALTPEEQLEALVRETEVDIASDKNEIDTMKEALDTIRDDQYYLAVEGRYINGWDDIKIAKEMRVEFVSSTIYRNRIRLVNKLVFWLYGSKGLSTKTEEESHG